MISRVMFLILFSWVITKVPCNCSRNFVCPLWVCFLSHSLVDTISCAKYLFSQRIYCIFYTQSQLKNSFTENILLFKYIFWGRFFTVCMQRLYNRWLYGWMIKYAQLSTALFSDARLADDLIYCLLINRQNASDDATDALKPRRSDG